MSYVILFSIHELLATGDDFFTYPDIKRISQSTIRLGKTFFLSPSAETVDYGCEAMQSSQATIYDE